MRLRDGEKETLGKRINERRLFFGCALLAALVAAGACKGDEERAAEEKPAVAVDTVIVEEATFHETVTGIGTLKALKTVEIKPEIDGIVQEIAFRESEQVGEGGLLFVLDDAKLKRQLSEARAALKAARASLSIAEKTHRRMSALVKDGAVSRERYDRAVTDLRTARAELARLEASKALILERLEDTRIRAPMNGTTSESQVDPGDYVGRGQLLVRLYHTSELEVDVGVAGNHAGRLSEGQKAVVSTDQESFEAQTLEGEVVFVSPSLDAATRRFLVKVRLKNSGGVLKPGAFARVGITVAEHSGRPSVPEEALVATREGYTVFVVEDGRAHQRKVETGLREVGKVEILSGLSAGETVVRTGHLNLSDGDRVESRADGVS